MPSAIFVFVICGCRDAAMSPVAPIVGRREGMPHSSWHVVRMPFDGMLVSLDRLRRGGADVTVQPLPGSDHVSSWIQAMARAVQWFRTVE